MALLMALLMALSMVFVFYGYLGAIRTALLRDHHGTMEHPG
jgi:hypothetical protein